VIVERLADATEEQVEYVKAYERRHRARPGVLMLGQTIGSNGDSPEPPAADRPPPDLADLLDGIVALYRRYVVLTDAQADMLALWVAHTHAIGAFDYSPYVVVTSAEKRSGKTTLMEVTAEVAARPWPISAPPSEAVLFRRIEQGHDPERGDGPPAVLVDEADRLWRSGSERTEPLAAIFNGGNRRAATVPRCVGQGAAIDTKDFRVFSPKMLVGLDASKWPDTITDRAIEVTLKRKAPAERVERSRVRMVAAAAAPLREQAQRWAAQPAVIEVLRHAEPGLPPELNDRAQDSWEPLLAIADTAGRGWPERARRAALELSTGFDVDDDSIGVKLLADCREVIAGRGLTKITSEQLVTAVKAIGESPWDALELTKRKLAVMLKPYGIRPKPIRIGDNVDHRGYHRAHFEDAWSRYLPPGGQRSATTATTATQSRISQAENCHTERHVADRRGAANPHGRRDVADVAATNGTGPVRRTTSNPFTRERGDRR
jgi:uncharacterized protein DUF3631